MKASPALALTLFALSTGPSAAASFSGYDFDLVGSATIVGTDLQLTPASIYAGGAAWLSEGISTTAAFSASFSYRLQATDSFPMADGISFAFQGTGTGVIGFDGGNIGYAGLGAVGVVIQTWINNTYGLNVDGDPFNTSAAPALLGDAALVTGSQSVHYDPIAHRLSFEGTLVVDGTSYTGGQSIEINLEDRFGATMYVGFTGATGDSYADQRITSFQMPAIPEPGEWALMLAGLGAVAVAARRRNRVAASA